MSFQALFTLRAFGLYTLKRSKNCLNLCTSKYIIRSSDIMDGAMFNSRLGKGKKKEKETPKEKGRKS